MVAAAAVVTLAPALILARFLQKFARLSVPPNKVVKIVESAIRMWPARAGGPDREQGDVSPSVTPVMVTP
jgi:hypothetical protein